LEQFLLEFDVVMFTDDLAHRWAEVIYDARQAGRRLEAGDAWIAATARLLGAPLLTHDRDFSPEACPSITVYCHA
jgi:predicted nucleic acid-binding protein